MSNAKKNEGDFISDGSEADEIPLQSLLQGVDPDDMSFIDGSYYSSSSSSDSEASGPVESDVGENDIEVSTGNSAQAPPFVFQHEDDGNRDHPGNLSRSETMILRNLSAPTSLRKVAAFSQPSNVEEVPSTLDSDHQDDSEDGLIVDVIPSFGSTRSGTPEESPSTPQDSHTINGDDRPGHILGQLILQLKQKKELEEESNSNNSGDELDIHQQDESPIAPPDVSSIASEETGVPTEDAGRLRSSRSLSSIESGSDQTGGLLSIVAALSEPKKIKKIRANHRKTAALSDLPESTVAQINTQAETEHDCKPTHQRLDSMKLIRNWNRHRYHSIDVTKTLSKRPRRYPLAGARSSMKEQPWKPDTVPKTFRQRSISTTRKEVHNCSECFTPAVLKLPTKPLMKSLEKAVMDGIEPDRLIRWMRSNPRIKSIKQVDRMIQDHLDGIRTEDARKVRQGGPQHIRYRSKGSNLLASLTISQTFIKKLMQSRKSSRSTSITTLRSHSIASIASLATLQ